MGPNSQCTVTVDGSELNNGDFAGICVLQGAYGFIALTKEGDKYYLVMVGKDEEEVEHERIPVSTNNGKVTLRLEVDFRDNIDIVNFYYKKRQ